MNTIKYFIVGLLFFITMSLLGVFIYLFCSNIIEVFVVWFCAVLCANFAELTSFYYSKIGLINMKVGDYILLAKDSPEGSQRMVGEVVRFAKGFYVISVNKNILKLDPKTLDVFDKNGDAYRFCGITQGQ